MISPNIYQFFQEILTKCYQFVGNYLTRKNRKEQEYQNTETSCGLCVAPINLKWWENSCILVADNFSSPVITLCHTMKLYNADTVPVGLLNSKHAKITQQQLRKNIKRSLFSGRVKFLLWQLQATGMQKWNILSQNTE